MEWLNLRTSVLHAPQYIGCDPRARSTWLSVSLWCAQQENGGRIECCRDWKDRQWQQTCGVTRREVDSASPLLSWDGSVLIVWNYPFNKESEVKTNRVSGRLGGQAKTEAKTEAARLNGSKGGRPKVQENLSANLTENQSENPTEGKGKERNGKGIGKEEGEGASAPAPAGAVFPPCLETPAFQSAWADWLAYRRERKLSAYKPKSVDAQLRTLADWGHDRAIASIHESIRQQWQGLFEPKEGQRKPSHESEFKDAF